MVPGLLPEALQRVLSWSFVSVLTLPWVQVSLLFLGAPQDFQAHQPSEARPSLKVVQGLSLLLVCVLAWLGCWRDCFWLHVLNRAINNGLGDHGCFVGLDVETRHRETLGEAYVAIQIGKAHNLGWQDDGAQFISCRQRYAITHVICAIRKRFLKLGFLRITESLATPISRGLVWR